MKRFLFVLGVGVMCVPSLVLANALVSHEGVTPYEITPLQAITQTQYLVGTLQDFPEMYEFSLDVETPIALSLRYPQVADAASAEQEPSLNVIIIRVVEPRGVEEVARMNAAEVSWESVRDPLSGLVYLQGPTYTDTLPPGMYRIEVSTPDNNSPYLMVLGGESLSFGEKFRLVGGLYDFYGVSKIGMLRSPLLLYPIGSIFLLGMIVATWYYRRRAR